MSKPTNKDLLNQILVNINSLEARIDKRFDIIEKRLDNVEKRLDSVEKRLDSVEHFIKRDADIIESELNQTVLEHLKKSYQGYTIEQYDKQLKTIRHPTTGNILTDFDGLYLLKYKKTANIPETRIFVIVEAKRYTTLEKVENKLVQRTTLENMIEISKNPTSQTTNKFKQTVKTHKLDQVSGVYLYIGGPYWEFQALEYVEKIVDHDKNPFIGYIKTSGTRYHIKDHVSYLNIGGLQKHIA